MFFKWAFKSAAAVLIVTNTWNIVMGVFDVAQSVVNRASGVIVGNTSIDISSVTNGLEARLQSMEVGELFGLWFQSLFVGITMQAITICVFLVTYGRMIEIYLVTSVAPIPMATMMSKEAGGMGQNYLRSLFALFDWRLGLIELIGMVLYMLITSSMEKKSRALSPVRQRNEAALVSRVLESLQGMSVIKSFNLTGKGDEALKKAIDDNEAFRKLQRLAIEYHDGNFHFMR